MDLNGLYPTAVLMGAAWESQENTNTPYAGASEEIVKSLKGDNRSDSLYAGASEEINKILQDNRQHSPYDNIAEQINKMLQGEILNAGQSGESEPAECEKSFWDKVQDYLSRTLDMLVFGNASEEVTLLGFLVELIAAAIGVDFILDGRDIVMDTGLAIKGEKSGWWILVDLLWLIPIVGMLKYSDEVGALVKK